MRLNTIIKKTNLTKKTIYFYIKENLIHPKKEENGYYIFEEADIKKLKSIKLLREAGLSIYTIKELFENPSGLNFFLHRQKYIIKNNIIEELNKLNTVNAILDELPAYATVNELNEHYQINNENLKIVDLLFPKDDSRMVAIIIWAPFLYVPNNNYRQFLWKEISKKLQENFKENLTYLKNLIYLISIEDIIKLSALQYTLINNIIKTNDIDLYVSDMKIQIKEFIDNPKYYKIWFLLAAHIIKPLIALYKSDITDLIKEYNNNYVIYLNLINKAAAICYEEIKDDPSYNKLKEIINLTKEEEKDINIIIKIIYTFKYSIFNCLTYDEINKKVLIQE